MLIIVTVFSGCDLLTVPDAFPYEIMIRQGDLPSSFHFKSSDFPENESGISYYVSFQTGEGEVGQFIAQEITIYPDEKISKEQYQKKVEEIFIIGTYDVLNSSYKPNNPEDLIEYKCENGMINDMPNAICEIVQFHQNLIMYVLVHINEKTMTKAEFENVMGILDDRLPDDLIPMPPNR